MLCDVLTGYVINVKVYTGSSTDITHTRGLGVSGSVVLTLLEPYLGRWHTLLTTGTPVLLSSVTCWEPKLGLVELWGPTERHVVHPWQDVLWGGRLQKLQGHAGSEVAWQAQCPHADHGPLSRDVIIWKDRPHHWGWENKTSALLQ